MQITCPQTQYLAVAKHALRVLVRVPGLWECRHTGMHIYAKKSSVAQIFRMLSLSRIKTLYKVHGVPLACLICSAESRRSHGSTAIDCREGQRAQSRIKAGAFGILLSLSPVFSSIVLAQVQGKESWMIAMLGKTAHVNNGGSGGAKTVGADEGIELHVSGYTNVRTSKLRLDKSTEGSNESLGERGSEPRVVLDASPIKLLAAPLELQKINQPLSGESIMSSGSGKESDLPISILFEAASRSHPLVESARYETTAAEEDLTAVERSRWPQLSLVAESESTELSRGNTSPQRYVSIEQTILDFGRKSALVDEARTSLNSSQLQIEAQKLELCLQIVSAWQSMRSSLQRSRVGEATLGRLLAYQSQMERRVQAQVSPRIDLELSSARVLQTRSEVASAKASFAVAATRLEQLSGLKGLAPRLEKQAAGFELTGVQFFLSEIERMDWQAVSNQLPSIKKAQFELERSQARLEAKKAQALPQVYARLVVPFSSAPKANNDPSVFVGLQYSPGAGFSSFSESKALVAKVQSYEQLVESAKREAYQAIQIDKEELLNASNRYAVATQAVGGSLSVHESFERQYQAGRKSWQELLNTVRELAQNQYSLAELEASMEASMLRVRLRMDSGNYRHN